MLFLQIKKDAMDIAARFAHRNIRRHADIQKQISLLWSAAGAPGMASANPAKINDCLLPAVGCFRFPLGDPLHDGRH